MRETAVSREGERWLLRVSRYYHGQSFSLFAVDKIASVGTLFGVGQITRLFVWADPRER
jgi:hypothetical protein